MRVIAIKRGFDNIQMQETGDEFEMPDPPDGKSFATFYGADAWFKPVSAEARKEALDAEEPTIDEDLTKGKASGSAYPNNTSKQPGKKHGNHGPNDLV